MYLQSSHDMVDLLEFTLKSLEWNSQVRVELFTEQTSRLVIKRKNSDEFALDIMVT